MGYPARVTEKAPLPAEEPWQRLKGETTKAYQHFVRYREMDAQVRSIRRLAAETGRTDESQLKVWSSRFQWVARVTAWDDHLERLGREAQVRAIEEAGVIRARTVLTGLQLVHDAIVGKPAEVDEDGNETQPGRPGLDPARLDAKDIAALGNMLSRMQALAEEAAGVKPLDQQKVDVRLSFDLDPAVARGVGHRVVEGHAVAHASPPLGDGGNDAADADSGGDPPDHA